MEQQNFRLFNSHSIFQLTGNMPKTPGGNQNTLYTYGGNIDTDDIPEYEGMR